MTQIAVRPAREEDREQVLTFCAHTWEWGDYIERTWNDWLHNANGLLLVLHVDERPAGIIHMRMLTTIDAWLEGLRVDPEFRGHGYAKMLHEEATLEAMRRGAKYIRLIIESGNASSQHVAKTEHMRPVGAFALYTGGPLSMAAMRRPVQDRPRLATEADLDEIIDYLNSSNIFPLTGGLYYAGFTAYPITEELLREKIAAGSVYILRRWERLDGLAIAEVREEWQGNRLSVGYIDGTAIEPISLIAYDLRRRLTELEIETIRVFAPELVIVRDAFTGIEYEWDGLIFNTYERGLE